MGKFEVKIQVSLSTVVEIEANSEQEAIERSEDMFYEENLLGYVRKDEYYDGVEITVLDSNEEGEESR